MKKNILFLMISSGFLVLLMLTSPFVAANDTPQWFPDEETEIDYSIRHYWTFFNGTDAEGTRFDVLYQESVNSIFLRPVFMRDYFPMYPHNGREFLANNTEVRLHVSYDYGSSTHLTRMKKLIWDSGESNTSILTFHMVVFENGATLLSKFYDMIDESLQRNNFPDHSDIFIDYINNQLGVGEGLGMTGLYHDEMFITATTSDSIIAFCNIFAPSNSTYVFGLDGKTKSFDLALGIASLNTYDILSSTSGFTLIEQEIDPSNGFPWNWVLIGVAGVELLVIVILVVVKKQK